MHRPIQPVKTTSFHRTSQLSRPEISQVITQIDSLITSLGFAGSVLAQRIAFPLLLLGAALVPVQPCAGAPFVFEETGSLANARSAHTATLLPNGKVLAAGGAGNESDLTSAELYDPASGTWATTGSLPGARSDHTATLLANGKVLVAGGIGPRATSSLASAHLYDPATGTWTSTGRLATARYGHTATLLPSGKVLVAGGYGDGSGNRLASAELYDPASGTWPTTGHLADANGHHQASCAQRQGARRRRGVYHR
jgi:hypothetical protein